MNIHIIIDMHTSVYAKFILLIVSDIRKHEAILYVYVLVLIPLPLYEMNNIITYSIIDLFYLSPLAFDPGNFA